MFDSSGRIISDSPTQYLTSTKVNVGSCIFMGYLVASDGTHNPTVTIYDGTSSSGSIVIPTSVYDATVLGVNGVTGISVKCDNGIYLGLSGVGAKVTIFKAV